MLYNSDSFFFFLQHNIIDLISLPIEQRAFGSNCTCWFSQQSLFWFVQLFGSLVL